MSGITAFLDLKDFFALQNSGLYTALHSVRETAMRRVDRPQWSRTLAVGFGTRISRRQVLFVFEDSPGPKPETPVSGTGEYEKRSTESKSFYLDEPKECFSAERFEQRLKWYNTSTGQE